MYSQNLIYNGDFEIYDTCPDNLSQPNNYQINRCLGWTNANRATPDYFNICSSNILVSIPTNIAGYQQPFNGNAYCGFLAYSYQSPPSEIIWWEYLKGELTSPLVAGKFYKITMYISLSENDKLAVKHLGVGFSNSNYFQNDSLPINNISYVETNDNLDLTNTTDWTKIEFYYLAEGGEKFMIIGNFRNPYSSDIIITNNDSSLVENAYYLIDALSLEESVFSIPNIFSPNQDGINDFFNIGNVWDETEMQIYNRWGETIKILKGYNCYWDGLSLDEKNCPEGVYYYVIKIGKEKFKGFLHLVR